jgi:hypothetical protein
MEFNFQYKTVIKENNIDTSKLSKDAKNGINDIDNILKAISMAEKNGKKVNSSTIDKVKRLDKWVALEILDYHFGTDDNTDDRNIDVAEVVAEIKKDATNELESADNKVDETIDANIDVELKALYDADPKKTYSIDELKKVAPVAYAYIWDAHNEGEENGVETTNYDVTENPETKLYLIIKK